MGKANLLKADLLFVEYIFYAKKKKKKKERKKRTKKGILTKWAKPTCFVVVRLVAK